MKVIFLKNYNGWGKGSVAKFLNEIAQDYIDKGYCAIADEGAAELKQPVVEESEKEAPVKSEPKEESKNLKSKI